MKKRNGFVSNSSSSSFIISGVKDCKMNIEVDLNSLSEQVITNLDELDQYFLEEYCDARGDSLEKVLEENYVKEEYNKAKEALSNGKTIFVGQVSSEDCDNPIGIYLYMWGFKNAKGMEVIRSE